VAGIRRRIRRLIRRAREGLRSAWGSKRNSAARRRGADDGLPLPPGELMALVAGNDDVEWYLKCGSSATCLDRRVHETAQARRAPHHHYSRRALPRRPQGREARAFPSRGNGHHREKARGFQRFQRLSSAGVCPHAVSPRPRAGSFRARSRTSGCVSLPEASSAGQGREATGRRGGSLAAHRELSNLLAPMS